MSGFVSGGGGGVVCRPLRSGAVWVWRAGLSRFGGLFPSAVCVPFASPVAASAFAAAVSQRGFSALARPACRCAAAFEVKIVLPVGVSVARARVHLAGVRRVAA